MNISFPSKVDLGGRKTCDQPLYLIQKTRMTNTGTPSRLSCPHCNTKCMNQTTLDRHRASKHNMQIGRKVDPNKRKTKEDSSDTSMEAPPKKAANMEIKKEEKNKDSIKVAIVEVKEKK